MLRCVNAFLNDVTLFTASECHPCATMRHTSPVWPSIRKRTLRRHAESDSGEIMNPSSIFSRQNPTPCSGMYLFRWSCMRLIALCERLEYSWKYLCASCVNVDGIKSFAVNTSVQIRFPKRFPSMRMSRDPRYCHSMPSLFSMMLVSLDIISGCA